MRQIHKTSPTTTTTKIEMLRIGKKAATAFLLAFLAVATNVVQSDIPPSEEPFRVVQPNGGLSPPIYLVGTAAYHREESEDGYTIIDDPAGSGWKVYAIRDPLGNLVSSGIRFGFGNPAMAGIPKHVEPDERVKIEEGGQFYLDKVKEMLGGLPPERDSDGSGARNRRRLAPTTGNVKNLVVMMKFKDHRRRSYPPLADFDIVFNNNGPHASICPTGSFQDLYHTNSYNQFTVTSTVPEWVSLTRFESYYAAGNSGLNPTFHEAIREALDKVDPFIDFSEFDEDGDGYIDFITFLHSGYEAAFGGTDCYGAYYTDRIWSHKWTLFADNEWTSAEGVKVADYHVSPAVWGTCGSDIVRVGIIAHEFGHFLRLPDLYDGSTGWGIGNYCLMGNDWGFDGTLYHPPLLSPWCKILLGWATPTLITTPGSYSIEQSCDVPQIYKIADGYPNNEYLLVENRQSCGSFEDILPQPGLTIWHIDELSSYVTEGYPGQDGWPTNGKHYRVALLQADGEYGMEKGLDRGESGDTWHPSSTHNELLPSTNILTGPFPNSDAYQGGNVYQTGHIIRDISIPGSTMTFTYENTAYEPPSSMPTEVPSSSPTDSPSPPPVDTPTESPAPSTTPSSTPSSAPTTAPSTTPTSSPTTSHAPSSAPTDTPSSTPTISPTNRPTSGLAGLGEPCDQDSDCESGKCTGRPGAKTCK